MAYRIARLQMTLSEAKGHFCFIIPNAHNSGNIACFNYSELAYTLESARGSWLNLLSKVEDFSRSNAVTYIRKVVISRKRCYIEML